jgi:hypothetical protein
VQKGSSKKILALLVLASFLVIGVSVAPVQAAVYNASGVDSTLSPHNYAYLVVNTGIAHTAKISWDGSNAEWYYILPQKIVNVLWRVWDDKGFDSGWTTVWGSASNTQGVTLNYPNSGTWVHAEVIWHYLGYPISYWPDIRLDIYTDPGHWQ